MVDRQVEKIMDIMRDADISEGRFPTRWTISNALPANGTRFAQICTLVKSQLMAMSPEQFSVGAFADSAHEYLLKQWLLTSKSEPKARDLCMIHAIYTRA